MFRTAESGKTNWQPVVSTDKTGSNWGQARGRRLDLEFRENENLRHETVAFSIPSTRDPGRPIGVWMLFLALYSPMQAWRGGFAFLETMLGMHGGGLLGRFARSLSTERTALCRA